MIQRGTSFHYLTASDRQCTRCKLVMNYTLIYEHSLQECIDELVRQGKLIRG